MDLKKLDYITAPEEWIEDILEKSSKTSPSKAFSFTRKYDGCRGERKLCL